ASRRRHTRFSRDWSSDVCSSDLPRESGSAASNDRLAWPQLVLLTAAVLAVSAGSISSELALNAGGVALAVVLLLLLAVVEKKAKIGRASCREGVYSAVGGGRVRR